MRTSRTFTLAGLVLAIGALLMGCAPATNGGVPPDGTVTSTPTPSRVEGQTLWSVTGTDQQLPNDDPDVQAVRTLVTVHSGVVDNRGPDAVGASLDEEFSFYAPEFAATLDNVGWRENVLDRAVWSESVLEQRGIAWMRSTIDSQRRTANVQYESYVVFTAGTEAFFQDNELELGTEYVIIREVTATVHDDAWLISGVTESGIQPRNTP